MTDDDRIDTLIDEVAQAMTSAPAAPAGDDFARRVSMRVAEAGERRQSWVRPWVLVPLAAAIVLIVLVRLKPDTTGDIRLRPAATPPAIARVDTPAPPVERPVSTAQRAPAAARIVPIVTGPPPAVEPIEIRAIDVQPLVRMDEIQIGAIAIDRIEIAAMP